MLLFHFQAPFSLLETFSCPKVPLRSMSTEKHAVLSIWSRKRDLVYLTFFAIHLPVIFRTSSNLSPSLHLFHLPPQASTAACNALSSTDSLCKAQSTLMDGQGPQRASSGGEAISLYRRPSTSLHAAIRPLHTFIHMPELSLILTSSHHDSCSQNPSHLCVLYALSCGCLCALLFNVSFVRCKPMETVSRILTPFTSCRSWTALPAQPYTVTDYNHSGPLYRELP